MVGGVRLSTGEVRGMLLRFCLKAVVGGVVASLSDRSNEVGCCQQYCIRLNNKFCLILNPRNGCFARSDRYMHTNTQE